MAGSSALRDSQPLATRVDARRDLLGSGGGRSSWATLEHHKAQTELRANEERLAFYSGSTMRSDR